MKRIHFITGLVAFVAFLATGMIMRFHDPPMTELSDAMRLFMRSRHIFILSAALLNLVAGCYLSPCPHGWRRVAQAIGSGLLILAPFPLVVAFFLDPKRNDLDAPISHIGLYALFAATVLHVVSCWRKGPVQPLADVHPASESQETSS